MRIYAEEKDLKEAGYSEEVTVEEFLEKFNELIGQGRKATSLIFTAPDGVGIGIRVGQKTLARMEFTQRFKGIFISGDNGRDKYSFFLDRMKYLGYLQSQNGFFMSGDHGTVGIYF